MKRKFGIVVIALLLAVLLSGCSTPRKLAGSTKETAKTEEKRDETITAEFRRTVDSTKTEGVEVTYTKIEFFPPEPDTLPTKQGTTKTGGPSKTVADTPKNRPKEPKEKQPPDTRKQGAIKSIETFTVKQNTEATGVTQEEQKTETTKTEEVNTDTDKETDVTEQPAADPYRWRYIFGILVLLVVGIILLRKTKVFTAVVGFFRKLF
ncbi:hypothetical protein [Alistipes putredinis]|uniref:hypothetical protein n=1 Tax=Alistipes putredinis TaxID=28117 RepID=UPI00242D57AF|nr:hypothetical protein [Alistipes putredinis]